MPILPSRGIPRFRNSPSMRPPNHQALLIGINYTSPPDDPEQGYRQLNGPVNDVKEMKKVLIEVYHYREEDIFMMTDEEVNKDTPLWPSETNILRAMLNLVRDAAPGDAFVFHYAGHSGQQRATIDPNEVDGLDEYIVTCDYKIILDNTLREYLVNKLPKGARLTAVLDACHSGTLLDLDHYSCHWFLRKRCQSLSKRRKIVAPRFRRHSDDDTRGELELWAGLVRSATLLYRMTFSGVATATLAIVRLKVRVAKRLKEPKDVAAPPAQRPRCGGWYCAYSLVNGPLVISVSSCSDHETAWEDSKRKGVGMTLKLIKILRKNPRIKVGDLNQQLKRNLSKLAFKRVRKACDVFRKGTAKMSPEKREELHSRFAAEGIFEFKEQTAQSMNDEFILPRSRTFDMTS
ncbi:caspase domain-containing protein [Multifurca ochricompacta]|uniref:Caspase domain-containing protein n=1 Tax=Multifurca ochricompacta TaxID=376703 RepID=A0AAD4M0L2_9AGAM|nr:caspase domain-containing protein [Multifurca ochricompacta]